MPTLNQPSHATSLHGPLLLLALAAALGACGEESPEPELEPGLLLLDREAIDFGTRHVGDPGGEYVVTVRNAGPGPLYGLRVSLAPDDAFEVTDTTCLGGLESDEACAITVAFTPVQAGPAEADLVVEADGMEASVALVGLGAVTVRVVNNAASAPMVVSEPDALHCGAVCEATFTAPEIAIYVADGGAATWSGPCESAAGGTCRLRLQADTSIELLEFASALQWTASDVSSPGQLSVDAENNVITAGYGTPHLRKLSPAGEVLWQTDELANAKAVAVDPQGNIFLVSAFDGAWMLDGSGDLLWRLDLAAPGTPVLQEAGFDAAGNLYISGAGIRDATGDTVLLAKYDGNGNMQWSEPYHVAGAFWHELEDMVVDAEGNVTITGSWIPALPEPGRSWGMYLRKYDRHGNALWTNHETSVKYELAVDGAGNIFAVDHHLDALQPWSTLQKYAPDGTLLWEVGADRVRGLVLGLAVTAAGDVIAASTRHDENGDVLRAWVAKFDGRDGTRRRPVEIELQTDDQQFGRDVAVDGNGDVIIAGGAQLPWLRKYDGAVFDQPDQ